MHLQSLLDLGASTNYKDAQELTPLYICVMSNNADPNCVHLLLHDHSVIDTRDANGWTEVHQVTRSCSYVACCQLVCVVSLSITEMFTACTL